MANPYPYGECTGWVGGRAHEAGKDLPSWGNAEDGFGKARSAGYSTGGIYDAKPGDILCGGHRYNPETVGHVQYVERDDGNTLYVSESGHDLSSPPAYANINKANPTYGRGDGFPFQGVIILNDSPVPPGPGGGEYDHTEYVTIPGTLCEDQEIPSTPTAEDASGVHPTGEEIQNVRGESLIEYTDERQIVYDPKSVGRGEDNGNTISTTGYDISGGD